MILSYLDCLLIFARVSELSYIGQWCQFWIEELSQAVCGLFPFHYLHYLLVLVLHLDKNFLKASEFALSDNEDIWVLGPLYEQGLSSFVFLEGEALEQVAELFLWESWEVWNLRKELDIPGFDLLFNFA